MKKLVSLFILAAAAVVTFSASAANVNIAWPANAAAEQIANYSVFASTNGGPQGLLITTTNTSIAVPNLPVGQYQFQVRANNVWGAGPASTPVGTPPPASAVVNVTITISAQ